MKNVRRWSGGSSCWDSASFALSCMGSSIPAMPQGSLRRAPSSPAQASWWRASLSAPVDMICRPKRVGSTALCSRSIRGMCRRALCRPLCNPFRRSPRCHPLRGIIDPIGATIAVTDRPGHLPRQDLGLSFCQVPAGMRAFRGEYLVNRLPGVGGFNPQEKKVSVSKESVRALAKAITVSAFF